MAIAIYHPKNLSRLFSKAPLMFRVEFHRLNFLDSLSSPIAALFVLTLANLFKRWRPEGMAYTLNLTISDDGKVTLTEGAAKA